MQLWLVVALAAPVLGGVPYGARLFQTAVHFSPDCVYSEWTPWSACSAACGLTGFASRSRVILEEPHPYGHHVKGEHCDTSSLEEWRDCLGEPCSADCQMSDWSEWGACSQDCGAGIRARARDILSPAVGDGAACGFTDQTQDCNNGPCALDCILGDWAPWSGCPPCGPGSRSRRRSIDQQGAFGGIVCDFADLSETETCFAQPSCAVDCVMDQWASWSACSSDCGAGRRDRSRAILVQPAFGGLACGPQTEWETCDNGPCAQDCVLAEWSSWSACPACGQASRSRQRSIAQQAKFGGLQCDFSELSQQEPCNLPSCSIDCVMSQWSDWSLCSADCGQGRRQRLRSILTQAAYGGRQCESTEEWESCDNGPCPQECIMGDWSSWSACPSCGQASRSRQRSIIQQARFGGAQCDNIGTFESESCNNRPCSVDCVMGAWSAWSQCSAGSGFGSSCGSGRRDRSRGILVQALYGGKPCGLTSDSEACSVPCNCVLGDWSAWSGCPACGPGSQSRQRSIIQEGTFGGRQCAFSGGLSETEPCNNLPCAIGCQVSAWSSWSQCSSSGFAGCGSGRQDRSRSILQQPAYGGAQCPELFDQQSCEIPCNCVLGDWSSWSGCPACGQASRSRSRSVVQEATFGGRQCDFSGLSETESCNNRPCAISCQMEPWTQWSQCSSQCGPGRRDRSRSILRQAAYGGLACGPTEDWEACDNGPCVRNCQMGPWSEWSSCCAAGVRTRWRQVAQQPSGAGALPCGPLDETEKCTPPSFPKTFATPPRPKTFGRTFATPARPLRKAFRPSNPAPKLIPLPARPPAFTPKRPFVPANPRGPTYTFG